MIKWQSYENTTESAVGFLPLNMEGVELRKRGFRSLRWVINYFLGEIYWKMGAIKKKLDKKGGH